MDVVVPVEGEHEACRGVSSGDPSLWGTCIATNAKKSPAMFRDADGILLRVLVHPGRAAWCHFEEPSLQVGGRCADAIASKTPSLKRGFQVLPHALYSPDLAPCDYHLFGERETAVRGWMRRTPKEWFQGTLERLVH